MPTVSLVGYTNAGKSTLFNHLTKAAVYTADQLFATLDPVLRKVHWPEAGSLILADTVGFIRHLPHDLVASFRATLQESREANLLLHIIDANDERRDENIEQVYKVLDEIGAGEVPRIEIYNKIDVIEGALPRIEYDNHQQPIRVWISALSGAGLDLLQQAISERLGEIIVDYHLDLPPKFGKARAQLFQAGAVLEEKLSDNGNWLMHIQLSKNGWLQIQRNTQVDLSLFILEKKSEEKSEQEPASSGDSFPEDKDSGDKDSENDLPEIEQ